MFAARYWELVTRLVTQCDVVFVSQHIRDVRWLSSSSAVCAIGRGAMQLFDIAAAASGIKHLSSIHHVHTDSIRELAVQEGQTGLVASGGKHAATQTHATKRVAAPDRVLLDLCCRI